MEDHLTVNFYKLYSKFSVLKKYNFYTRNMQQN